MDSLPAHVLLPTRRPPHPIPQAEDRFYNQYPCIIITAKGQPDVATRLFLRRLKTTLKIPVLALVDSGKSRALRSGESKGRGGEGKGEREDRAGQGEGEWKGEREDRAVQGRGRGRGCLDPLCRSLGMTAKEEEPSCCHRGGAPVVGKVY